MVDTSGFKLFVVGLRCTALSFVMVALGLVAAGTGVCYHKPYIPGVKCFVGNLSLLNWHGHPSSIMGQYFVLLFSLVLIATITVAAVFEICHQPKNRIVVTSMAIVNLALCLSNVFVEAYYASTWLTAHVIHPLLGHAAYNQSWVAATSFYAAASILFIFDLMMETLPACVSYEKQRPPSRPSPV